MAAGWTFSTCVVTMRPIAMANNAAMMICHTDPGSLTRCQNVCFSGWAMCIPDPEGMSAVLLEGESVESSLALWVPLISSLSPMISMIRLTREALRIETKAWKPGYWKVRMHRNILYITYDLSHRASHGHRHDKAPPFHVFAISNSPRHILVTRIGPWKCWRCWRPRRFQKVASKTACRVPTCPQAWYGRRQD
jgi:hypothetical protein